MALIGYCRVSRDKTRQDLRRQIDQLRKVGCDVIVEEYMSGERADRPKLAAAIARTAPADTLVAISLDRVARSLRHLLEIVEALKQRGAYLRILDRQIDTSTADGTLLSQLIGAFAEFELKMIRSRTKDGVAAARRRGRVGGNPGIKAGNRAAIDRAAAAKSAAHLDRLIESAEQWMPTVRRLRPASRWPIVAEALNAQRPKATKPWTAQRLQRAVRTLVANHMADTSLLVPAPRPQPNQQAVILVATIKLANPELTYKQIGQRLTEVRCYPPRGRREKRSWSPASIRLLVEQGRRLGLLPPVAQPISALAPLCEESGQRDSRGDERSRRSPA